MEKILIGGKVTYRKEVNQIKDNHMRDITYDHIVARSTQEGIKQLEFLKQQISRLQRQINFYNELRKELQHQIYGN